MIVINSIIKTLTILRKHFETAVIKFFEDFLNNGNPFVECEQDLVNVVSKTVVYKESLNLFKKHFLSA